MRPDIEFRALTKNGGSVPLDVELSPFNKDGRQFTICVLQDTSAQQELLDERDVARDALHDNQAQLHDLVDNSAVMSFTVSCDGKILSLNEFAAQTLGYGADELTGSPADEIFEFSGSADVGESVAHCILVPAEQLSRDVRLLAKNGEWVEAQCTIHRMRGSQSSDDRWLLACQGLSGRLSFGEALETAAEFNNLMPDLLDRAGFQDRLQRSLENRDRADAPITVCQLDVDQFKVVVDLCGHIAADDLLRDLVSLLRGSIRTSDTLARLNGDQFAILLEGCSVEKATNVANELLRTVRDMQFLWQGERLPVTASVGLVSLEERNCNVAEVLSTVNTACRTAKQNGGNRIHMFRPDDSIIIRRRDELNWILRLEQALQANEFELYYQPIVPLVATNPEQPRRYELLLRLRDEDDQILSPGLFMEAAETFGLASKIDRWVINAAFEWLAISQTFTTEEFVCNINLSASSLNDVSLADFAISKLKHYGISASRVCFELTETATVANLKNATLIMQILSAQGCEFALDDFGAGFSSFFYLRTLPVEFVKIDGSLVKDIATNRANFDIVKSINQIAQALGKRTIAEYIEDEESLNVLKEMSVDYAQGYYLGKPKSVREFDLFAFASTVVGLEPV